MVSLKSQKAATYLTYNSLSFFLVFQIECFHYYNLDQMKKKNRKKKYVHLGNFKLNFILTVDLDILVVLIPNLKQQQRMK